MRLFIGTPQPTEKPVDVGLSLIPSTEGGVRLIAVDENGERFKDGNLLRIHEVDGQIVVDSYNTVNPALGFKRNGNGGLDVAIRPLKHDASAEEYYRRKGYPGY